MSEEIGVWQRAMAGFGRDVAWNTTEKRMPLIPGELA
jgi:hypothetical protein